MLDMETTDTLEPRPTAPLELALDAALELEALAQGVAENAPSFISLVQLLKEGRQLDQVGSVAMLSDVRGVALVRRALPEAQASEKTDQAALRELIAEYLNRLLSDVEAHRLEGVREAKRFSLGLNRELLKRQHERLTSRRWRQESAA